MNCLWCDTELLLDMSWTTIFKPPKPYQFCLQCLAQFELLADNQCEQCSQPCDAGICKDCEAWSRHATLSESLITSHSVFTYNDIMREVIAQWKIQGDYVLGKGFKDIFTETFLRYYHQLSHEAVLVPIPLSQERLSSRGFNQSAQLAELLPVECEDILTRTHSEKQAKKTRRERLETQNPFKVTKKVNKTVILVDDIYTTGMTLRQAGKTLKESGCKNVYAFTLIR